MREKRQKIFLLGYCNYEIIVNTKTPFTDEKLFELFCNENDLNILQNVAIYLFKYFVSHITVIPRNDTFLPVCSYHVTYAFQS